MSEYTTSDEIRDANRRLRQVEQHLDDVDQRAFDPDDPFAGLELDETGWQ